MRNYAATGRSTPRSSTYHWRSQLARGLASDGGGHRTQNTCFVCTVTGPHRQAARQVEVLAHRVSPQRDELLQTASAASSAMWCPTLTYGSMACSVLIHVNKVHVGCTALMQSRCRWVNAGRSPERKHKHSPHTAWVAVMQDCIPQACEL